MNLLPRIVLFAFGLSLVPGLLAAVLAVVATTAAGRTFGVAGAGAVVALGLLLGSFVARRPEVARPARRSGAAVGLIAALLLLHPQPSPGEHAGAIESHWLGSAQPLRWSSARRVPERDQFELGARIVFLDPLVDGAKAKRIRRLFGAVYDEGANTPGFRALSGAMPHAYRELWGAPWRSDHLFVQAPDGPGPHPTVLFVHGSAGNFKGYQVVLGALRDRGWAVVSPSFGFGNWWREGGTTTLAQALDFVDDDPRLDGSRVAMAALSNGGCAITRSSVELADRLQGVAWLSGIVELDRLDEVAEAYRGRPTWLLHGDEDARIPVSIARRGAEALGEGARLVEVPGEDHFLFFSDRPASVRFLDEFLTASVGSLRGAVPDDVPRGTDSR